MATNHIYQWARLQPEKNAFIYNDVAINYATFWRMIAATRRFFAGQRLPVGGTALVCVHSIAESWIITLGLRALGLNTIYVQNAKQAHGLISNDLACVVITRPPEEPLPIPQHAEVPVVVIPRSLYADCNEGPLLHEEPQHPFGGQMLFTSATTGLYKKVLIDGRFEEKRNATRAASWSLDRNTVLHSMNLPLWTGAGFKQPSATWHAGGCMIFEQRSEQFEKFLTYNITKATLVESVLRPLLEKQIANEQARKFELVFGAGFLSQALAEKTARQLTPNIEIQYGCTELATYALHAHYKTMDDLFWMTVATDRVVQVVNEDGMECPVGVEGELRIQLTDIDCSGYLDDAQATTNMFRDGYFYPGDMAVAREGGRIRILGRCADVLNVQGNKIAVAPMELLVKQHFCLEQVCLFAGLNDKGEEELVVAIEADVAPDKSEMAALHPNFRLFENLRIEVFKEFPRAESGMRKIQRSVLRSLVFSDR